MFKSPNLKFNLLVQNQSQKEVTVNESLIKIDAMLNNGAISSSINLPPLNPKDGDLYIVGKNPTGEWQGKTSNLAYYYSSTWHFIAPKPGCIKWVLDLQKLFVYTESAWVQQP